MPYPTCHPIPDQHTWCHEQRRGRGDDHWTHGSQGPQRCTLRQHRRRGEFPRHQPGVSPTRRPTGSSRQATVSGASRSANDFGCRGRGWIGWPNRSRLMELDRRSAARPRANWTTPHLARWWSARQPLTFAASSARWRGVPSSIWPRRRAKDTVRRTRSWPQCDRSQRGSGEQEHRASGIGGVACGRVG
jgi:hypothetical protein